MNRRLVSACLALPLTAAAQGEGLTRQQAETLMDKHACAICHLDEGKSLGPSLKELAAKYRGDAASLPKLAERVKAGGGGVWGQVPMPPNPNITDAELRGLLQWIMAR